MKNHPLDLFHYCPKCGSEMFKINNFKSKHLYQKMLLIKFNVQGEAAQLVD